MTERNFICKNCGLEVVDFRAAYEYRQGPPPRPDWRHVYSGAANCYEPPIVIPVEVSGQKESGVPESEEA